MSYSAPGSSRPRMPETKALQMLIDNDQRQFQADLPGVQILEVEPISTGDDQALRSFTYSPAKTGNWERVSYGEDGEFFLIFTVSSKTKNDLLNALDDYKKFIGDYRASP